MDPEVLGDLVAPARRSDAAAYRHVDEPARMQTYDSICTTAWQTANLLRLYGVHAGATVGIVDGPKHPERDASIDGPRDPDTPIPEVITALLGTALLEGVVQFDPDRAFEGAALLCPAAWTGAYDVAPGCTILAYGGPPTESSIVHFESEVWSETPIAPPESPAPDADVLAADGQVFDQTTLLSAARGVVDEFELTEDDVVAIDAPLSRPGTVVAGVIAPLLAGTTIQVGEGDADHRIGERDIDPESVTLRPADGRSSRA